MTIGADVNFWLSSGKRLFLPNVYNANKVNIIDKNFVGKSAENYRNGYYVMVVNA